jgi:Flp pilus assembly protein TadD
LEAAARLNGSLPGVHYDLGVVLGDLGENVQAEAAYRLALGFEPNNPDTNNNLGILLAMRGDIAAAVELFSRAVSADPGHENAIDNLAQARALMNR